MRIPIAFAIAVWVAAQLLAACGERADAMQTNTGAKGAGAGGGGDAAGGGAGAPAAPAEAGSPADAGMAGSGGGGARPDAGVPDGGGPAGSCADAAIVDTRCDAQLCSAAGMLYLLVRRDEPKIGAALNFTLSICERAVGWPSRVESDYIELLYALTLADVAELRGGARPLVYWSNPTAPPAHASACTFDAAETVPACPGESPPLPHGSLRGCRGPLDAGCEVCKTIGPNGGEVLSGSEGADWYNQSSTFDPRCGAECPACASCTHRDELESRALAARPECEPCPDEMIGDACFDPGRCECWCATRARLRDHCPTLVQ